MENNFSLNQLNKDRGNRIFTWPRLIIGLILIGISIYAFSTFTKKKDNPQVAGEKTETPAPKPSKLINYQGLEQRLEELLESYPEVDFSVIVKNIKSDEVVAINPDREYIGASTTKLITASYLLKQIEDKKIKPGDKLGNFDVNFQFKQLVNRSNNVSWLLFHDLLGVSNEEEFANSLGFEDFKFYPDNLVIPEDMADFLEKLYKGAILNKYNTQALLNQMRNTEEERFIPPNIPKDAKIYHKNGLLDDNVHDVSIIEKGDEAHVLVIYSNGQSVMNYDRRIKIISQIVKTILGEKVQVDPLDVEQIGE